MYHRSASNKLKIEVIELKKDKRAYSSALIALKEKSEQMNKDLNMKEQNITALEEELSRKRGNNGKTSGHPWSLESLSKIGMERYQGIFFSAGKYAANLCKLVVSETYLDELHDYHCRRDWNSSSTKTNYENAKKAIIYVKVPDGVPAIQTCNMLRALNHEFFSSPLSNSVEFLKACFRHVLEGPVGSFMDDREKMNVSQKYQLTDQQFEDSGRYYLMPSRTEKNAAKITFLKSLGYRNAALTESKNETAAVKTLRNRGKDTVLRRCVNPEDEDDTSYWRNSEWEQLCLPSS